MNNPRSFIVPMLGSCVIIETVGMALGVGYLICPHAGCFIHATPFVDSGMIPAALAFGALITAVPTFLYSAALSLVLFYSSRCRRSVWLASSVSILLTALVFVCGSTFISGTKVIDNMGFLFCSIIAGLIGTAFIRWYYRREEARADSTNAAVVKGDPT